MQLQNLLCIIFYEFLFCYSQSSHFSKNFVSFDVLKTINLQIRLPQVFYCLKIIDVNSINLDIISTDLCLLSGLVPGSSGVVLPAGVSLVDHKSHFLTNFVLYNC